MQFIQTMNRSTLSRWVVAGLVAFFALFYFLPQQASAQSVGDNQCPRGSNCNNQQQNQNGQGQEPGCGTGDSRITTKFNFGCNGAAKNPIVDLALAIIRFLAAGVGVVVVISIILAGIQYSTSEGNPEATMKAKRRVQASLIALVIYIFTFAIINYLVPGGFLNR